MIEALLGQLQRGLTYSGVLLLIGVAVWSGIIRPAAASLLQPQEGEAPLEPLGEISPRIVRIGRGVTALLLPLWMLGLVVQVLGFRDPFVPLAEDVSFLLGRTLWGTVWIAQGLVLLVLVPCVGPLVRSPSSSTRRVLGMALVTALPITLGLSSHAMSESGIHRIIAVGADAVHLMAAGAWIGTLALILLVREPAAHGSLLLAAQLRAFSPLALTSVSLLVTMGIVLGAYHLSAVQDLWSTPYGRVLVGKLLCVGVVLLLGFLNWRRGLPTLDSEPGRRVVRLRAAWEVATSCVVLAFTAVLTGTPTP